MVRDFAGNLEGLVVPEVLTSLPGAGILLTGAEAPKSFLAWGEFSNLREL